MKRVLITSRSFGSIDSVPTDILTEAGYEVVHKGKNFDQAEFDRIVPEFDALIIGAHPFDPAVMETCSKLKIICKHGVGLDNIPLQKAKEMGIKVCNAPGTNSNAVADLAIGLMLAACRNIVSTSTNVKGGGWKAITGRDLCYKTLGLLGFGAIARNVAKRANGFGMKVLAYDPYVKEVPDDFKGYVTLTTCEAAVENADFLSLHLPLTDETRGIVSAREMARMKEGAYIINTSRGGTVDEKDLYDALVSGHIAGAALDVTIAEPVEKDNPLLTLDNVVITPHVGMYTREAINAVGIVCAKNCAAMVAGEPLSHQVV